MLLIPLVLTFLTHSWSARAADENAAVSTVISTGTAASTAPLSPPGENGKAPAAPAGQGGGDPNKPLSSGPPPGGYPGAGNANPPGLAPGAPGGPGQQKATDERKIEAASLFSYKDAEGNLKIVDSIDAVPEKFRAKAKPVKKKD